MGVVQHVKYARVIMPYPAENFCWTKISPNPSTLALQFLHVVKIIIGTIKPLKLGQKIHRIKNSPMKELGEEGENFLQAEISSYYVAIDSVQPTNTKKTV